MADEKPPSERMSQGWKKTLPVTVDRPCPKCGNDKAYGPEYRRGEGNDQDLGEHLRYYCTICRFAVYEPTKDTDTPMRRAELEQALVARAVVRKQRWDSGEYQPAAVRDRERDIQSTYRSDRQGWRR